MNKRLAALITALLLATGVFAVVSFKSAPTNKPQASSTVSYNEQPSPLLHRTNTITAEGLNTAVNNERQKLGLQPLSLDERLNKSAQAKCDDMITRNYWAHVDPEGQQPWHFIQANFSGYKHAGENLGKDFYHDQDIVSAWMNSPKHRENIVYPYNLEGFAVCGVGKQNYVVQYLVQQ